MFEFLKNHWFLLIMMAVAGVFSFIWLFVINKKLKMKWWEAALCSLFAIIFGIVGSIIAHYFENGFQLSNIGTSAYGAIFITPLVAFIMYLICKRRYKYLLLLDNYSIVLSLFMILTRINCLKSGCCLGMIIGDTHYRYPTREADILINSLILIVISINVLNDKNTYKHFFAYLVLYGISRFIIEWFREPSSDALFHNGHWWSIIAIVAGMICLILFFTLLKRQEKSYEK